VKRLASISAPADNAPGYRGITLNWDWITRPLFGGALAALVIAATFGGPPYVALYAAIAGIAAAREWHRMIGEPVYGPIFFVTALTLIAALAAAVLLPATPVPWAILAAGAGLAALVAAIRGAPPVWHGMAALYIGVAMVSAVLLRGVPEGAWIIVGMFLAIWATDTGALFTGNLVGGPRLWPALSPNKTWAGTFGGIVTAAAIESVYVAVLGGHVVPAALLGAAIAVVAHCGDLFESWVKRIFQLKDSGGMIPGHGGVLDRIDSTLFVVPVMTLAVFAFGLNPMFGAHP
jgi:phosphatidate cytidylyltransferase